MLIFDIETNGLLDVTDRIHCCHIYDTHRGRYLRHDKMDVVSGLKLLQEADCICGHNIIGFDIPVIQKVFPGWEPKGEVLDTLVWSRLSFGDIKSTDFARYNEGRLPGKFIGSHSLKAWGYRLMQLKGDFDGPWDTWTQEMSDYCLQDVKVTKALADLLQKRPETPEALELEHQVAWIIAAQERHGFLFDKKRAEKLYVEWLDKRATLKEKLQKQFPPFYLPTQKNVFTPKRDDKKRGYVAGAPMCKIKLVNFNPTSGQHIAGRLSKKYGWEPSRFTEKSGEPKVDEDVLKGLDYPEIPTLIDYLVINKRIAQLAEGKQAWLKCVKPDGRIHGAVNSCGAVTGRMTHFNPNVAQVPAGYSPFGEECRGLFIVPPGYKLVGADASGLEARCLAHFLARYDDGEFVKVILEGKKEDKTDVHNLNATALGCNRDIAKTWFYAWMYGAGIAKLAAILGCTPKQAKKKQKEYYRKMPAFGALKDAIDSAVRKRGYLKGLDGRILVVRSAHSALNTLLQSAGAVIMKKALVILDEYLQKELSLVRGVDYAFVANVHDEFQIEVKEEHVETVGKATVWAIEEAGKYFEFRCPLTGDYQIGDSWKETH